MRFINRLRFYPQTVQMTKALLFLKAQRPDIQTVDFLAKDTQKVALLAQAFDGEEPSGMALLEKEQPFSLASIKKSCEQNLRNYINTRGSLDDSKKFNPSLTTQLFRSQVLTNKKVSAAEALITAIHAADSIDVINDCVQKAAQNTHLQQGTWTKGYQAALGKCLLFANLNTLKPDSQLQP